MAGSNVVINDLISFEIGDVELEKLLGFLYSNAALRMDCRNCGMTIIPQCRSHHNNTKETEFKVNCIDCNSISTVRMYGKYGFILPTDDEFYKGIKTEDGWEK